MVNSIVRLLSWLGKVGSDRPPKARGNKNYYGTKRELYSLFLIGGAFFGALAVWSDGDKFFIVVACLYLLVIIPFAFSAVVTDERTITIRIPGLSYSRRWEEITEIKFNMRGDLLLMRGEEKLVVELTCCSGRNHLIQEIKDRTMLEIPEKPVSGLSKG
jgi:hypothetical protein